jgi:hypothetical protein
VLVLSLLQQASVLNPSHTLHKQELVGRVGLQTWAGLACKRGHCWLADTTKKSLLDCDACRALQDDENMQKKRAASLSSLTAVLEDPKVLSLLAVKGLAGLSHALLGSVMPLILHKAFQLSVAENGLVTSYLAIIGLLGAVRLSSCAPCYTLAQPGIALLVSIP